MSRAVEGVALLPCPFCGGKGDIESQPSYDQAAATYQRHRGWCDQCGFGLDWHSYEPDAITAWNTRTTPPARSYADGVAMACDQFEAAIGEGYPPPPDKTTQCAHGQFGWEDCIACYDEALIAKTAAIRLLSEGGKA